MSCRNIAEIQWCLQIFFLANQYEMWGIETYHEQGKNCKLTNILIKFMANKHHCISWAYLQEKQRLSKPVVSWLSVGGVWQGKALYSYPQAPEWQQKGGGGGEEERNTIEKNATGREKRVSAGVLPSSAHLCRDNSRKNKNSGSASEGFLLAGNHSEMQIGLTCCIYCRKKNQTNNFVTDGID